MRTQTVVIIVTGAIAAATALIAVSAIAAAEACPKRFTDCTNSLCCESGKEKELDECDRIPDAVKRHTCLQNARNCYAACKSAHPPQAGSLILAIGNDFMYVPEGASAYSYSYTFMSPWPEGDYFLTVYNGHPTKAPNTWAVHDAVVTLNGAEVIASATLDESDRSVDIVVHLQAGTNTIVFNLDAPVNGGPRFIDPYLSDVDLVP